MLIELHEFYINQILNDTIFILYLVTITVDVLTGNAVALYQRRWNSKTGINGTIRHLALFSVIGLLLPIITFTTHIPTIANGIMLYIIAQYTISILENLSALGIDITEGFTKYFEFLGKNNDNENKQDDKKG